MKNNELRTANTENVFHARLARLRRAKSRRGIPFLRSMFKVRNSQKGMTLVEVIIALLFVGILLVLYSATFNTVMLAKKLKYENIAYHVANKEMEQLRAQSFASLPPSGTITDSMLTQIPSGAGNYTVNGYAAFSGMKEIVVTVTWNDGIAKQVQIKSLTGTGGINP